MDLTPYVESLRRDLTRAAAAGTEQAQQTAGLLGAALEPAIRLSMVDALSAMAAEVTAAWGEGSVEVRMHGREPQIVVAAPLDHPAEPDPAPARPGSRDGDADDGALARLTVRLPEPLKSRAEQQADQEGVSLNSWMVRAVAWALGETTASRGAGRPGRRFTGYARS